MEPGTRATDEEYINYCTDASCDESDNGSPPCVVDATHTMRLGISGHDPAIVKEPHCDMPVEVQVCNLGTMTLPAVAT